MILNNSWYYWRKGLPKDLCNDIIKHALTKRKKEATTGDIKTKEQLENQKVVIRDSKIVWLNDKWIYDSIRPFINFANEKSGWNFDVDAIEDLQFTIYNELDYYNWHADQNAFPYKKGFFKGKTRKISMSILLNDPNDFEGGELQFDLRNSSQGDPVLHTIDLNVQGSLVVFPSFVWHRVKPVKKGIRYSLVCWSLGKPFK